MREMDLYRITYTDRVIATIYVALTGIGGFPIVPGLKIAGIVPTYYRIIIPIIFLYFLVKRLRCPDAMRGYDKKYVVTIGVLFLTMAWGCVLLLLGQFVDRSKGIKELMYVGLGVASVIIIYEICLRQNGVKMIMNVLRMLVVATTILAIVEMSTGFHLYSSRFSDPDFIKWYLGHGGKVDSNGVISYDSTSIFFNENDFGAFLGMFVPLFFPQRTFSRKVNTLFIIEMAFILIILTQNDAWICMFSPIIGVLAYLLITRTKVRYWLISAVGFAVVKMYGVTAFSGTVYLIYKLSGSKVPSGIAMMFKTGGSKLPDAIKGQLTGVEEGTGSVFTRIDTYIGGVSRTFTDSHGLGFGPGSYTHYIKSLGETKMLSNPHSMWLEILMQYGVVIFLIFLAVLIMLFIRLCINYHNTHRKEYAILIAIDVIFAFICFAPSSFFGISYMWVPIGLSLALSNIVLEREDRRRAF